MTSPDIAAQRIVAAVEARDRIAYRAAGQELVDVLQAAGPDDIEPALGRLAPTLSEISLERGSGLAQVVGGMAGRVADTRPVLGVLVERACEAMEGAARFLALHRELLGDPPDPAGASAVGEVVDRFAAAAAASAEEPRKLAFAWFAAPDWVQPVLILSQRADVRAALPQRERLLSAVEAIRENLDVANWLHGLLLVLDDAPLIVLHRQSGRGYRVTIGGIGNNAQLQTLLAARLIGEPGAGWLPGVPPSPDMTAAADGSGPMQPPGGIVPQFSMADPRGAWVPGASLPADIPLLHGEQVIILDPPSRETWGPGRVYPLMQPSLRVEHQLTPEDAAAWLAMAWPAQGPPDDQLAWTDDLTITLPPGRTAAEVVDLVLQAALRGTADEEIELALAREFHLNEDDAHLARDRTFGGLVRAATRNPGNRPAPDKDPIAFESFRRGEADRSLIARIYPEFA